MVCRAASRIEIKGSYFFYIFVDLNITFISKYKYGMTGI